MMRAAEVLVVGAGPTGLTLALQAHAHGAHVRIVERRTEAFRPSRALIMHARTLEVLRPLGVTEALLARANTAPEGHLHLGHREVDVRLADLALPDTAFPHLTFMRQADVEQVLAQALADRGVEVERGTELIAVSAEGASARVVLESRAGIERQEYDFVAGCDGPESLVRRAAGIGWPGAAYGQEVVLADLEISTDLVSGVAHVVAGRRGLLFLFALGERATWRLLATRPAGGDLAPFGQPGPALPAAELQAMIDQAGFAAQITEVAWSARYRLQHRVASHFRHGRFFLAGDAAHAFSPATGQGMNTGIQDAINLGWKLAFASSASDSAVLLDSYELERRPVAWQTLALTHVAFWGEASTSPLPALFRGVVVPLGATALPTITRQRWLVALGIRVMSQLLLAYPNSPISVEHGPRLHGWPRPGHRLPDRVVTMDGRRTRLHTLLARPGVHVLLERDVGHLACLAFGPHLTLHRLSHIPGTGIIAVRSDGYVGFTDQSGDTDQLAAWLARVGAGLLPPAGDAPPSPR